MVKPKEDLPPLAARPEENLPPGVEAASKRYQRVGAFPALVPFEHSRRDPLGAYVRVCETSAGEVTVEIEEAKLNALLRRAFLEPSGIVKDGMLRLRVNHKKVVDTKPAAPRDDPAAQPTITADPAS